MAAEQASGPDADPPFTAEPRAGGETLAEALLSAARSLRRLSQQAMAPLGLSPHQSRALRIVATDGPLRPSTLADRLGIAPRSATDVLDTLADAGLLVREPDPGDRRALLIRTTPAGQHVAEEAERQRASASQAYFAALTQVERDTLARLLSCLDVDNEP